MRRTIQALAFLLLAGAAYAHGDSGESDGKAAAGNAAVSIDAGAGIYYKAFPLPEGSGWAILAALFNVRGGPWIDVEFRLADSLHAGFETGCQYMASSADLDGRTVTLNLVDVPLRAKTSFRSGMLTLESFAGLLFDFVVWDGGSGTEITPGMRWDGGLRLMLRSVYAEASLEVPFGSDPGGATGRFGAGYCFRLAE